MKRPIPYLALAVFGFAMLPVDAPAQEPSGELVQLIKWEINPPDAGQWVEGVQKIVAAAKQAKLAQNYAWSFWQEDIFEYRLVYPVQNMAYFDDPQQWMRQFANTPGQATLMQAFEQLNAVASTTVSDMVSEQVTAWSRETALDMSTLPHAHVDEVWLKGGVEEQHDALMKEFVAFLSEMGYVYPVLTFRPRLGGTGEHQIVTLFDSRENFYGKNNLDRLIEQKGATDRWTTMLTRFSQMITKAHHFDSDYKPNMSYSPQQQASVGAPQ